MSAYLAIAFDDRIEIVSDGALFDPAGIFLADIDKIDFTPLLPIAVTGVGIESDIAAMKLLVFKATCQPTVDDAIAYLRKALRLVHTPEEKDESVILIAALSEKNGPQLYTYSTVTRQIVARGKSHAFGPELSTRQIIDTVPDLTFPNGLREDGSSLLKAMRLKPCSPLYGLPEGHYVGGHIDHAVVSANGVQIERVHEWDDTPGQPINPSPAESGAFSLRECVENERKRRLGDIERAVKAYQKSM